MSRKPRFVASEQRLTFRSVAGDRQIASKGGAMVSAFHRPSLRLSSPKLTRLVFNLLSPPFSGL